MAKRTKVDDNPENAFQGHNEVKGQMSAFLVRKPMLLKSVKYVIECNLSCFFLDTTDYLVGR